MLRGLHTKILQHKITEWPLGNSRNPTRPIQLYCALKLMSYVAQSSIYNVDGFVAYIDRSTNVRLPAVIAYSEIS